jgi:hypothetical protein
LTISRVTKANRHTKEGRLTTSTVTITVTITSMTMTMTTIKSLRTSNQHPKAWRQIEKIIASSNTWKSGKKSLSKASTSRRRRPASAQSIAVSNRKRMPIITLNKVHSTNITMLNPKYKIKGNR